MPTSVVDCCVVDEGEVTFGLLARLRVSDTFCCCSSDVRLYEGTPPTLRSALHDELLIHPRRVALVARSEWFVLKPGIPAVLHRIGIILERALCPRGSRLNQTFSVGFFRHWR